MVGWGRFLFCAWKSIAADAECTGALLFPFVPYLVLPTTHCEPCCVLVVVQRIFQNSEKTVAPLESVFPQFSFSF